MSLVLRASRVALAALAGAALLVLPATAQSPPGMTLPQDSSIKGPRNMQTARQQIVASSLHLRRTLQEADDPLRAWINTWMAYVEMRAAHENMNYFNDGARWKNPFVPVANPKFLSARRHILWARNIARAVAQGNRPADASYHEELADNVNQALQAVKILLVTPF